MTIKFYKDGKHMAIETDCRNEEEFVDQISGLLDSMIEQKSYDGDWCFQFTYIIPIVVDLCCAYRGYKSGVEKHMVLVAGDRVVCGVPKHEWRSNKDMTKESNGESVQSVEDVSRG